MKKYFKIELLVIMYVLAILVTLAIGMTSCGSASGNRGKEPKIVTAKLQAATYNPGARMYTPNQFSPLVIKEIAPMYEVGDLVQIGVTYYIVISMDRPYIKKRDYQLDIISEDSMALYDGNRKVGNIFLTDDSEIGYMVIHDNE